MRVGLHYEGVTGALDQSCVLDADLITLWTERLRLEAAFGNLVAPFGDTQSMAPEIVSVSIRQYAACGRRA